MKYFIFLSFFILTHSAKSQILNVQTAHKLITTAISMTDAKKLLNQTHNFISQGETSDAGNINYQFESKSSNHYTLNILYSTAFDRIAYIQIYDDIKQAGNYRSQFLKLGFTYIKTNYTGSTGRQSYGYQKGNLLYVVELGVVPGQCKIHLENKDF